MSVHLDQEAVVSRESAEPIADESSPLDGPIVLVVTVDGFMSGISRDSGKVLWTKKTGAASSSVEKTRKLKPAKVGGSGNKADADISTSEFLKPLLSTTTTTQSAASSDLSAVPSIDGNVYLTGRQADHADGQDDTRNSMTVSTSVRELVQRAPFLDPQGRFYVGTRQTTAAAIDQQTGEILTLVSTNTANEEDEESKFAREQKMAGRDVLWVGRVDYSVAVQDARTGSRDVDFRVAEVMSLEDMRSSAKRDMPPPDESFDAGAAPFAVHEPQSTIDVGDEGAALQEPWPTSPDRKSVDSGELIAQLRYSYAKDSENAKPIRMISTPGGNLGLVNEQSDELEWVSHQQFDTPVAFAIDGATGKSIIVDIIPDVTIPSTNDMEYLRCELARQWQLASIDDPGDDDQGEAGEQTIVGRFKGSGELYALPLGRQQSLTEIGSSAFHSPNAAALASATSIKHKTVPQLGGNRKAKPFGKVQSTPEKRQGSKQPCLPTSPGFPSCLVDHHKHQPAKLEYFSKGNDNAFASEGLPPFYGKSQSQDSYEPGNKLALIAPDDTSIEHHQQQESIQGLIYHPDYGYVDLNSIPLSRLGNGKPRSFYSRILSILGSWLPATIVLIFVVSFELGRRKRSMDEASTSSPKHKGVEQTQLKGIDNRDINISTQASSLAGENAAVNSASDEGVVLQQRHVIQVSDEVLGFGGQGTVVYKGILDGREVAVKRMLKAYHASADREIRLLIESDGHPNVVRYFLKEIRGDFVYLALELCDLSLHDLIGVLRSGAQDKESDLSFAPSKATRVILQQISCGVRHLHSLRIVHRDLKPANILLAVSKRRKQQLEKDDASIVKNYEDGLYLAKISDMGLGKQIVGQSSLGASLMATSSFQGTKGGTSSVGVGPGSVGWQAPEVMATRWVSSDSSARSGEASSGGDCTQGVPDDLLPSTRTSRSVDVFSLGCIFYSTLVPGKHPFGEWYEREANIMHNRPIIDDLERISPDAFDLVRAMISRNQKMRPTAKQVCEHPFFWESQRKLSFLCEFSDRLETDVSVQTSIQLINVLAIERGALDVVGTSWDHQLDAPLISNVQKFRTYDSSSVRDLLRLIRNKHHHFDELPEKFRVEKVPNQDLMLEYFEERFPKLVMHCWNCCRNNLTADDPLMLKYEIPPSPRVDRVLRSTPENVVVKSLDDNKELECLQDKDDSEPREKATAAPAEGDDRFGFEIVETQPTQANEELSINDPVPPSDDGLRQEIPSLANEDFIVWEGSTSAKELSCRGWSRSMDEWSRRIDPVYRRKDQNLKRAIDDPKFRTRLCNHWDLSLGTKCPMKKKNKCVFAHGPVELRVKEGKKNRWGRLVDKNGDNNNPRHSGGEDTYGAARSIETARKEEGKWNTGRPPQKNRKSYTPNKKRTNQS